MATFEDSVGYVKFYGSAVENGTVGAEAAGKTLLAVDDALKYFNRQQSKGFSNLPYEITVRTDKGSWEIAVIGGIGIFVGAYVKKAAEKMAENDFKDVGMKDVLRKSVDALRNLLELAKHTKGNLDFANTDLSWRASHSSVGITNQDGEEIYIPLEYFRWYLGLPKPLLTRLTNYVEENRILAVGSLDGNSLSETTVELEEKPYFGHEDPEVADEFLFPELEHGMRVELEGRLTRGNENTNSLGLEFDGHVLNCVPEVGSIVQFKPALFLRCRVFAIVSRLFKQSVEAERRPTLIVSHVIPLESDDQLLLFGR